MPIAEPLPKVSDVPSDRPLLAFQIDRELLRRLDKYRFSHEFPSRAAAVLAMVRWVLDNDVELRPAAAPPE